MQPVLTVLKGSDARRRYNPPARPYHLFYYTGFVNTFTENGRTFYPYPPLRGTSFHRKEGASTRAPSYGRGCRAQRGGVGFLFLRRSRLLFAFPIGKGVVSRKAVFSYRSLPHWGRGTASAVDRVLSFIVDLRRSFPLFFIPLVPYPARFARHLPHAGKALYREKRYSRIAAFPIGEGGPRQRWIGCFRKRRT